MRYDAVRGAQSNILEKSGQEKMKRVAVITDAVSSDFYFRLWHKYYSRQVGSRNLFVVSFGSAEYEFSNFELGGITSSVRYENNERVNRVQTLATSLLEQYDLIVRVDTDEFLVPNPCKYSSLSDYLQRLDRPHVTAMGYNVLQDRGETALDLNKPILISQRRIVNPYDALSKTCIITAPVTWTPGFHFCSEFPQFHDLYLLHFKLADLDIQIRIGQEVAKLTDEQLFKDYHLTARDTLAMRTAGILSLPRYAGIDQFERKEYNQRFISHISHTLKPDGIYHGGSFAPEQAVVEIPPEFKGYL
jgi:hypothetical protein